MFVKVGNRYINLEMAQEVRDLNTIIRIYFSGFIERNDETIEYDYIIIDKPEQVNDVRRYLERNSEDVSAPHTKSLCRQCKDYTRTFRSEEDRELRCTECTIFKSDADLKMKED